MFLEQLPRDVTFIVAGYLERHKVIHELEKFQDNGRNKNQCWVSYPCRWGRVFVACSNFPTRSTFIYEISRQDGSIHAGRAVVVKGQVQYVNQGNSWGFAVVFV